ncbi:hypothetical protein ACQB60_35345 [Actinomycetota bacterium Odt1-20B]
MPASEHEAQPQPYGLPGISGGPSIRDLLAACAAADAVSTPPRDPEPAFRPQETGRRDAA